MFVRSPSHPPTHPVQVGVGLGKLFTLGGVGIWWVIDIALLAAGQTGPADGSAWEPYY